MGHPGHEQPGHKPGAYLEFLRSFIDHGYTFSFFNQLDPDRQNQILMRHDIDFSIRAALEMAETEAVMGVRSTYFFLLGSRMYNLLDPQDFRHVAAIRAMGHEVSLHFDASVHPDIEIGLRREVDVFKALFQQDVRLISFHRPDMSWIARHDREILGIENTYQTKYFRSIRYMSDSTGAWRYGHPCESEDFRAGKNMQLLIHPIWWTFTGEDSVVKLDAYFASQVSDFREEIARNCIPFRERTEIFKVA